ncbi:MAG: hypothetical protein LLF94_10850 [Chlamydiales bacterium]|nr:hypothetical protein [Chlamydiales bacterium]
MIKVKTKKPEKLQLTVKDENQKHTVFTDRWKTVDGETTFFVRMPVSGKSALISIYNQKYGQRPKEEENTFEVLEIRKLPLEKKIDVIDFGNHELRNFVNFATAFAFNAGHIPSGTYKSSNGKYTIEYLPTIISSNTGKEMETPARISKSSGRIQVSQKKFITSTVPMRMAILLHEYSHFYVNENIDDETEADLNGLMIYLGLGYPRFEAHEAFLKTFIDTPSYQNKERYERIKAFIDNYENQNLIFFE